MYGITYLQAENKESLNEGLKMLFSDHEDPILLEVFTPRMLNDTILKDYFNTLS
jgi:2-succinyl-5-enolpyruvyl-6-hydroxy-3-cyclohexene-1-carboxylate synthase